MKFLDKHWPISTSLIKEKVYWGMSLMVFESLATWIEHLSRMSLTLLVSGEIEANRWIKNIILV